MTVGYGYLAAATGRPEDKDEQITSMDLEGIRKYMCPISNGDFRRCQNCQGLKTCRVGQRVVVLLNQRDQKNESAKWAKVMDVPDKPANQDDSKRQFLREACLSGNAWEYVMRKTGKSRDAAKELLLELIRKYPGIAAEYGGSRRIMQRPRVTVIANHQEQQPEQVLSPVEPETPQAEKDPNDGRRKTALAIAEKRREKALALYRECLQASDPIAQYMERRNATESAARLFFSRMRKKYGEMESEAKSRRCSRKRRPGRNRQLARKQIRSHKPAKTMTASAWRNSLDSLRQRIRKRRKARKMGRKRRGRNRTRKSSPSTVERGI